MEAYFFFMDWGSARRCAWVLEENGSLPVEEAMTVIRRHHCYYATTANDSSEHWSPDPEHRSRRNHLITYTPNSKYVLVD